MLNSLWPCGLKNARLPCPSLSPWVCSNSCPLSWWWMKTISFHHLILSCPLLLQGVGWEELLGNCGEGIVWRLGPLRPFWSGKEGADYNSLGLPNDLGRGLEGADKGSPSREMMVLPTPLPCNLSVKAILVNVPQVIEQNGYSAAFRWDIPQISVILYMLIDGVFEPLHMLANFLSSCSISHWEGHWSF